MPQQGQGQQYDPFAAPEGETGPDRSEDTGRDIDRDPVDRVKRALTTAYIARKNRGAVPASLDNAMKDITDDAHKEIESTAKWLKETDKTRLGAVEREVVRQYRGQRARMGMADKGYVIVDLSAKRAAGTFNPGTNVISIDDDVALNPDVQDRDILYGEHVCDHEGGHKDLQARVFNSEDIRAGGRRFVLHPNIIEGQVTSKFNKQDGDKITADYKRYMGEYEELGRMVGVQRLDEAIKSGDLLTLQEEITANEKKPEKRAA